MLQSPALDDSVLRRSDARHDPRWLHRSHLPQGPSRSPPSPPKKCRLRPPSPRALHVFTLHVLAVSLVLYLLLLLPVRSKAAPINQCPTGTITVNTNVDTAGGSKLEHFIGLGCVVSNSAMILFSNSASGTASAPLTGYFSVTITGSTFKDGARLGFSPNMYGEYMRVAITGNSFSATWSVTIGFITANDFPWAELIIANNAFNASTTGSFWSPFNIMAKQRPPLGSVAAPLRRNMTIRITNNTIRGIKFFTYIDTKHNTGGGQTANFTIADNTYIGTGHSVTIKIAPDNLTAFFLENNSVVLSAGQSPLPPPSLVTIRNESWSAMAVTATITVTASELHVSHAQFNYDNYFTYTAQRFSRFRFVSNVMHHAAGGQFVALNAPTTQVGEAVISNNTFKAGLQLRLNTVIPTAGGAAAAQDFPKVRVDGNTFTNPSIGLIVASLGNVYNAPYYLQLTLINNRVTQNNFVTLARFMTATIPICVMANENTAWDGALCGAAYAPDPTNRCYKYESNIRGKSTACYPTRTQTLAETVYRTPIRVATRTETHNHLPTASQTDDQTATSTHSSVTLTSTVPAPHSPSQHGNRTETTTHSPSLFSSNTVTSSQTYAETVTSTHSVTVTTTVPVPHSPSRYHNRTETTSPSSSTSTVPSVSAAETHCSKTTSSSVVPTPTASSPTAASPSLPRLQTTSRTTTDTHPLTTTRTVTQAVPSPFPTATPDFHPTNPSTADHTATETASTEQGSAPTNSATPNTTMHVSTTPPPLPTTVSAAPKNATGGDSSNANAGGAAGASTAASNGRNFVPPLALAVAAVALGLWAAGVWVTRGATASAGLFGLQLLALGLVVPCGTGVGSRWLLRVLLAPLDVGGSAGRFGRLAGSAVLGGGLALVFALTAIAVGAACWRAAARRVMTRAPLPAVALGLLELLLPGVVHEACLLLFGYGEVLAAGERVCGALVLVLCATAATAAFAILPARAIDAHQRTPDAAQRGDTELGGAGAEAAVTRPHREKDAPPAVGRAARWTLAAERAAAVPVMGRLVAPRWVVEGNGADGGAACWVGGTALAAQRGAWAATGLASHSVLVTSAAAVASAAGFAAADQSGCEVAAAVVGAACLVHAVAVAATRGLRTAASDVLVPAQSSFAGMAVLAQLGGSHAATEALAVLAIAATLLNAVASIITAAPSRG